jgi:NAD(P)-dependent dehydrogenase (short-subunit alcohol dehydrogenase family)/acyl dehydratase
MPAQSDAMPLTTQAFSFLPADVDLFARASHDINPLHMSAEYTRRTAFGARVVHGMLAALACLGRSPGARSTQVSAIGLEFKAPVYMNVSYRTVVDTSDHRATVRLVEGERVVLTLTADFSAGTEVFSAPRAGAAPRTRAAQRALSELVEGWERRGTYGTEAEALDSLLRRWLVAPDPLVGKYHSTILMALSYLVGMEAPGEAALFSRATVVFDSAPPPHDAVLDYYYVVREQDARFDLVRMEAMFSADGAHFARATIDAFVRPSPVSLDANLLRTLSPPSSALCGRSAIVVGGSRGLGAALTLALADQHCKVGLCFAHSRDAAESVANLAATDRIELLQADAGDAVAFEQAARDFCERNHGLDFLICSACPPLSGTSFHVASIPRIAEYISQSVVMAAVPLAVTLRFLEAKGGAVVMISSSALSKPPRDWPHYVTAKAALEGLVHVAIAGARRVRALVVRPPRLRTDLVNSPGPHPPMLEPEIVAARVVSQLTLPGRSGVTLLDDFVG